MIFGTTVLPPVKGEMEMREEYIVKINELLNMCQDLQLLDLIHQLLQKTQQA
jgi:hypothetical protein